MQKFIQNLLSFFFLLPFSFDNLTIWETDSLCFFPLLTYIYFCSQQCFNQNEPRNKNVPTNITTYNFWIFWCIPKQKKYIKIKTEIIITVKIREKKNARLQKIKWYACKYLFVLLLWRKLKVKTFKQTNRAKKSEGKTTYGWNNRRLKKVRSLQQELSMVDIIIDFSEEE